MGLLTVNRRLRRAHSRRISTKSIDYSRDSATANANELMERLHVFGKRVGEAFIELFSAQDASYASPEESLGKKAAIDILINSDDEDTASESVSDTESAPAMLEIASDDGWDSSDEFVFDIDQDQDEDDEEPIALLEDDGVIGLVDLIDIAERDVGLGVLARMVNRSFQFLKDWKNAVLAGLEAVCEWLKTKVEDWSEGTSEGSDSDARSLVPMLESDGEVETDDEWTYCDE